MPLKALIGAVLVQVALTLALLLWLGVSRARSARRGEVRPTLLTGGNPQVAKGDGDPPVRAYIAAAIREGATAGEIREVLELT